MYWAAVFAVAHSPAAGALSHVLDVGAIVRIWDSDRVVVERVLEWDLGLWRGVWRGWAVVVRPRVRPRVRRGRICILELVLG